MSVSIILLGVITAVWVKLCHLVYITMLSTSLHHFLNISYFKPKKKKNGIGPTPLIRCRLLL